jgi:hypothetical protein
MLLFDGLVHYDTHVILIGNYVTTFACQAVSSPCICGGSGCTLPRRHGWVPSHQALERDGAAAV